MYYCFNNHLSVQRSSPVVETSAGVPLISVRPFAVPKWSAWLVSKESPRLSGSTYLTAPLPSSPYTQHTKNTPVTKNLCSQYSTKTKQTCRSACTWSSGDCNWWPVSRHESLDNTLRPDLFELRTTRK
jgi:hypothetical protein